MFFNIQQRSFSKWIPLVACIGMTAFAVGMYSLLSPFYQVLLFTLFSFAFTCLGIFSYQHIAVKTKADNTIDDRQTRILLVDDNRANRRIINEILRPFPIAIIEASSGQQAIALYDKKDFDLILMDIELQDMNGMEVAHYIRQQEQHRTRLPMIAISAHSDNEKKIKALTAGFDDYITKPVDKDSLTESLSRWSHDNALVSAFKQHKPHSIRVTSRFDEQYDTESNSVEDASHDSKNATLEFLKDKSTDTAATIKKVVDVKLSLKYSNNNYSLARDMLELLLELVKEKRPVAQALYKEKNWPELAELAHKINGGSCYCGVPELQKQAQKLEKALERNQTALIEVHYPLFIHAIDNLLEWEEEHDIAIIFDK